MTTAFMPALVLGAAVLALWIDRRFPALAPPSLVRRVGAACLAFVVLGAAPVFHGSAAAVYATVFAVLLPVLVWSFLASVWLLRSLSEAQLRH